MRSYIGLCHCDVDVIMRRLIIKFVDGVVAAAAAAGSDGVIAVSV